MADSRRRRLSCHGVGQMSMQAGRHSAPASAHPSSRGPIAEDGWATATGSTNSNEAAVDAVAAWGETMPAKSTTNPTTAMATTDNALLVDTAVPRAMKAAPVTKRMA